MSTTIPTLLSARAEADPRHVALAVHEGSALTYAEWDDGSNLVGRGLMARGVQPGDRVALYFDNAHWTDYALCYLAAHKAGAVAVPLSPRFSPAELAQALRHADVALIVAPTGLPPAVPDQVVVTAEALAAGERRDAVDLSCEDDLAEIIYTSGTTGDPKGVAITHRNLALHDLPPDTAPAPLFLHAFPVGTNAGQECLRMPLRRTATAVVLPRFDPELLCAAVSERHVRRLQLVPSMARLIIDSGAATRHDVSSVARVILSSAPAAPELWAELARVFPSAALFNAYALTEGGAARTLTEYDPARPTSVGRPVGETEIRIVDERSDEVAIGTTGEVCLRRRGATRREYYKDAAATAAAFAGDWLRTGDLGYVDGDGYLHLVDRLKDVIITGGVNVSSMEVEEALVAHPAVGDAAVFGVVHAVLGQDVAAAVVLREDADVRALQHFVRGRLAEHKVPHQIFIVDALPRNASGKVVKRELRERFAAHGVEASRVGVAWPPDPLAASIAAIWRDVLGIGTVAADDDFFALGGQSLAATQVAARVRDRFGVDLPSTAVFEHPTVAELAAAVAALRNGEHVA